MAATASALGRAYFCSDRRFSWPLLAISRGRLTPASARCVRAEWRSWCSVQPVLLTFSELLLEQVRGSFVGEPATAGDRAQVQRGGRAGGAGAAVGEEDRPGVAVADQPGQQAC